MAQNTSSAVMQQRSESHDSLDDFPTPPWATRALIEHCIMPELGFTSELSAWDPACNRGYMTGPLREYFDKVHASDIHDYPSPAVVDFLMPYSADLMLKGSTIDFIITNPPFRLAEQFIKRCTEINPRHGFAMLVRTSFLEGEGRYRNLFTRNPPSFVYQFAERVIMQKGIVRDPRLKYFDPKADKWKYPSTATSYCWLLWLEGEVEPKMRWIPPCRIKLERPGDYVDINTSAKECHT